MITNPKLCCRVYRDTLLLVYYESAVTCWIGTLYKS